MFFRFFLPVDGPCDVLKTEVQLLVNKDPLRVVDAASSQRTSTAA